MRTHLVFVAASALVGCLPPTERPAVVAGMERPRVFVEAMLVDVPTSSDGRLSTWSFSEIAMRHDVAILAAPCILTEDRSPAQLFVHAPEEAADGVGQDVHFSVVPRLRAHDEVRLDIDLEGESASRSVRAVIVTRSRRITVLRTNLAKFPGRTVLLLVRADVVRSEEELRAVFEQRMRELPSGGA